MENTPTNKEAFFALYINQKVLSDNLRTNEVLHKSWNWSHKDFWLNLKSLSDITDEDAKDIGYKSSEQMKKFFMGLDPEECDLLRLKGYAVQWADVSVEKQIEYGWIKLKQV